MNKEKLCKCDGVETMNNNHGRSWKMEKKLAIQIAAIDVVHVVDNYYRFFKFNIFMEIEYREHEIFIE